MSRTSTTQHAPNASPLPTTPCIKCSNAGLVFNDQGMLVPCDCGKWEELQRAARYAGAQIPPRFRNKRLESFEARRGEAAQLEVKESAKQYVKGFHAGETKGLLLRGGTGVGKTHIAVGILMEVLDKGVNGTYCNITDLLSRLRDTYTQGATDTEGAILEDLDRVDLLVLDDLGAEKASEWVLDRLYLVINRRYENARPIIVTTNCDDASLRERVGPRIVSRLYEMCMLIDKFPEKDQRMARMR